MASKTEDSSLLSVDDIVDWPGLCNKLRQNDGSSLPDLSRKIMPLLPQRVREMWSVAEPTAGFDQACKSDFVAALNEALKRRNLLETEDTKKLTVNEEAKRLLSRNRDELSDQEVERLNRLLLEALYPQEIRPRQQKPYVGPRSFQKDQRGFFFGRDEEASELVSLITAHQAVLFYSQSGAGKTSLLQASLIPMLEQEEQFNVLPPMRVQGQISETFKVGRKTNIFALNALMSCRRSGTTQSQLAEMTFAAFLAGQEQPTNRYGEPCPTVIVFDQFEELFTSYPGRWPDREDFFAQLGDALEGNPKKGIPGDPLLRAVFCMREDFIAELDPYVALLPEKLRTRFRLEHLREEKALLAITKPLEKTNRKFAKGVAEELVKNLLKIPSQSITGTQTIGLYVEPVQLQVVCQSLWDALKPGESVIDRAHLEKYGDVSEALSNFYENSIRVVAGETKVKEEDLRKWFGDTLITSEGTRAPVNRGQEKTGGMPNASVDMLEAMRLIKGEWKGTNVRWYELAHDRFIEPIRRSNNNWLASQTRGEQIRLRLEARASKWQPGSSLLDVDELIEARRLVKQGAASKALRALVDASKATAQRQRIRRLTAMGVALLAVAAVVTVLAVIALRQSWAAKKSESLAKSRLLATRAGMFVETDPELSVLLGAEALKQFEPTQEARNVIRRGLSKLSNVTGALRGHEKRVNSVTISPDGHFILTTSDDGTARLWNANSKSLIQKLGGRDQGQADVLYSTFSPDGSLIVTTSSDGLVRVCDGTTGASIRELRGHTGPVNWAAFSGNGSLVATASDDNTGRVWNVGSGELVKELKGHEGKVKVIAFSSDGYHVATEAVDTTARIWDLRTDKVIKLAGLSGPKPAIAFSPDGKLLATEGGPGTESGAHSGRYSSYYPVTVWDVATGNVKFTLDRHDDFITEVSFSPDGKFILTSSGDNTAYVWTADGKPSSRLTGHTKAVTSARFSPNGKLLVTTSADNTARIWDPNTGKTLHELCGHTMALNSAVFSPNGQLMLTASDDKTVRIWTVDGNEDRHNEAELREHSEPVTSAAFSPDGAQIVTTDSSRGLGLDQSPTASSTGAAFIEDLNGDKTAPPLTLSPVNSEGVMDAAFSPDGTLVVTTNNNKALLWNIREDIPGITSKKLERTLGDGVDKHKDRINSVVFSPNGKLILTASSDATARVWNAESGETLAVLAGHTGSVNSAAFSPDGKFIVTASEDGLVRIWDGGNYTLVRKFGSAGSEVFSAQYSPDGRLIVTTSGLTAKVWNATNGSSVAELRGHTDKVYRASFSPVDSKLIATASADQTARVWDAQTGQSIVELRGHTGSVLDVVFSPNGKLLLTTSTDYTARIYLYGEFAPFEVLQAWIPQRVARELTPQERKEFLDEPQSK